MKKILALVLSLVMCLSFASTALAVNEDVSGKLMIYTSMYQFVIDMMDEALAKEFPNLDVEFFYAGTGSLQTKITGEMETGTLGCDMMLVAEPAYSLELMEGGWLEPIEVANPEANRFEYDPDGYWYSVRVCDMVLAYNPELYTPEELPKTFYDFAFDPSLKGQISMGNPLTSGTTMAAAAALSEKYGYEYFSALGANDVMIESGSVALAKLQTGECKVIMILEESVLKIRKEEGSKLAVIYPEDGVIVVPSTVMTVAEDRSANMNIEAATAVTEWLLSDAGQAYIIEGYMHTVSPTLGKIPYDSVDTQNLIDNQMSIDWERCYKQREEIRTEFQERVTIAQ